MELLADIHAALAQDALLGIIGEELVGIVDGVVIADALVAGLLHAVLIAQVLQLALAVLGAAEAVGAVGGEHQVQHGAPGGDDLPGLGMDDIALSNRSGAGGEQLGIALDLHQADPAGSLGSQVFQIAQRGDLDAYALGGLQDGASFLYLHLDAVDRNIQHSFLLIIVSMAWTYTFKAL